MSPRSMFVSLSVAAVATTAFLSGCSSDTGGTSPEPGASTPAGTASSPAASDSPTSPTSASPSAAASSPSTSTTSAGGSDVSAAGGKVTWVMPCDKPAQQELGLNENDKKDIAKADAWRCGNPPKTTAAAFAVELKTTPASDGAAKSALRSAAGQIVPSNKPKEGDFQGHPGVSSKITQNGATFELQGVAVDKYLVFFVAPEGKLDALTGTVTIS